MLLTIKDLKDVIKNLPDDMPLGGYNGGNGDLVVLSHWISEDEESEESPTFVISTN